MGEAYDRYAPRLFRYLVAMTGSTHAAEDALQEIFCRLAERGAFFAPRNPEKYLFRAAHNEALTRRRRAGRETPQKLAEEPAASAGAAPAEDDAPDADAIDRALAQLPPEQAEVIHLKVREGLTFARIGTLVGCSTHTAASRYRYACDRLRKLLGEKRCVEG